MMRKQYVNVRFVKEGKAWKKVENELRKATEKGLKVRKTEIIKKLVENGKIKT